MLKKINDITVKPIRFQNVDKKHILGSDLFPEIYSNVFLCAKKKSGKTSTILHIIRKCADKRTNVIIFCSTCEKDKNYAYIREYLKAKNIPHQFHQSIKDDKHDYLGELLDQLQYEESEPSEESEPEPEPQILSTDNDSITVKIKKRKPKYLSQKYLIIFDDLSLELKTPNLNQLLKTNRHYKAKILISSQYLNDLLPMARRQIDVYLLWGGLNEEKLKELYQNADLDISFEKFQELYNDATKDKYNFFYVDASNVQYRKNFNQQYIL